MRRSELVVPALLFIGACDEGLDASSIPLGDPIALGQACAEPPIPTHLGPGGVVPNLVGFDQFGEEVDLYADLCDRHVVVLRAGFD